MRNEPVAYTSPDRLARIAKNSSHVDTMWGKALTNEGENVPLFLHPASEPKALYLPCPICNGVEGCDHTVPERRAASEPKALTDDAVLQSAADLLSDLGYSRQADVVRDVIADRRLEDGDA